MLPEQLQAHCEEQCDILWVHKTAMLGLSASMSCSLIMALDERRTHSPLHNASKSSEPNWKPLVKPPELVTLIDKRAIHLGQRSGM